MPQLQTIKVRDENPRGWKIINASDFDPAEHVEFGAESAKSADFTREGIATMDKADVVDLLEMHGANFDKRQGVGKLRDMLTAIMFVES